jgi:hypothetical protein
LSVREQFVRCVCVCERVSVVEVHKVACRTNAGWSTVGKRVRGWSLSGNESTLRAEGRRQRRGAVQNSTDKKQEEEEEQYEFRQKPCTRKMTNEKMLMVHDVDRCIRLAPDLKVNVERRSRSKGCFVALVVRGDSEPCLKARGRHLATNVVS